MAAINTVSPDSASTFLGKTAGPCIFVLFGAAGDLTKRKLVPALFNLVRAKLLPDGFAVMGVSVDELDNESFRKQVSEFLPTNDVTSLDWLRTRLFYERGDFGDAGTFTRLRDRLAEIDAKQNTGGNYLFYLATAPKFFAQIVGQLGRAELSRQENGHWRRVVIEKPFGQDLDSAKTLNRDFKTVLQENQIYRIDH
jgi:glucose-6-phosphate 1-dehydrogenase